MSNLMEESTWSAMVISDAVEVAGGGCANFVASMERLNLLSSMASRDPTGPAAPEAPVAESRMACHSQGTCAKFHPPPAKLPQAPHRGSSRPSCKGSTWSPWGPRHCGRRSTWSHRTWCRCPGWPRLGAQTRGPLGVVHAPHRLLVTHALHRDVGLDDAGHRRAAQWHLHEARKELGDLELIRAHQHVHQVVRDAREGLREHHQLGVGVVLGVQLEADGLRQARRARGDHEACHRLRFGPRLHVAIGHGPGCDSIPRLARWPQPQGASGQWSAEGLPSESSSAHPRPSMAHLAPPRSGWESPGIRQVLRLLLGSHHLPVFIFRLNRIHISKIHFHLPFRGHRRRSSRRRRHGSEKPGATAQSFSQNSGSDPVLSQNVQWTFWFNIPNICLATASSMQETNMMCISLYYMVNSKPETWRCWTSFFSTGCPSWRS